VNDPSPRHTHVWLWVGSGALVVMVLAAAVWFVAARERGATPVRGWDDPAPPFELVHDIAVAGPGWLAPASGGGVWVTSTGDDRHTVVRLDEGLVVERVVLDVRPGRVLDADDDLWITAPDDDVVVHVAGPRTPEPPPRATNGVPGSGGSGGGSGPGVGGSSRVTEGTVSTVGVPGSPLGIAGFRGALWVTLGAESRLVQIDADTARVDVVELDASGAAAVTGTPRGVAVATVDRNADDGVLWFAASARPPERVAGGAAEFATLGQVCDRVAALTWDGDRVRCLGASRDLELSVPGALRMSGAERALFFSTTGRDEVVRVLVESDGRARVTHRIAAEAEVFLLATDDETLWLSFPDDDRVVQVAAPGGPGGG